MNIHQLKEKFFREGKLTWLAWVVIAAFIVLYVALKQMAIERREWRKEASEVQPANPAQGKKVIARVSNLPEMPLPAKPPPERQREQTIATPESNRKFDRPSFDVKIGGTLDGDNFLPKGTMIFATLTSDIVSNNQISPATATVVHPTIFAHKVRIPVGTHVTGKISPGNLRGRVFVNWDTLIFYEEGRQGYELPIKGIGMTYEQHPQSGRWMISGAGLKGYVFDESSAAAFKLAALSAMQDFAKTLQTLAQTQNTIVSGSTVTTTTVQTPDSTLRNSGLAAAESFIDVIASRYAATLQQQTSFVLVPTARFCAIFLDEPVDLDATAPGRSLRR
jgi:hypothetical protein